MLPHRAPEAATAVAFKTALFLMMFAVPLLGLLVSALGR
jgi:hypothetical protein